VVLTSKQRRSSAQGDIVVRCDHGQARLQRLLGWILSAASIATCAAVSADSESAATPTLVHAFLTSRIDS